MDRCTRKLLASAAVASSLFVWSGCSSSEPPPPVDLGPSATEKQEMEQRDAMIKEMMKNKPGQDGSSGMPGMPPGGGAPDDSGTSPGPR